MFAHRRKGLQQCVVFLLVTLWYHPNKMPAVALLSRLPLRSLSHPGALPNRSARAHVRACVCVPTVVCACLPARLPTRLPTCLPVYLPGVWGGKGQGKTFQVELLFKALDMEPIIMSAGELESEWAGEPGQLIRSRYRDASLVINNRVRGGEGERGRDRDIGRQGEKEREAVGGREGTEGE